MAKPTADLLRSVAPDVREVSLVAEAFGLEEPPMDGRRSLPLRSRAMASILTWRVHPSDRACQRNPLGFVTPSSLSDSGCL